MLNFMLFNFWKKIELSNDSQSEYFDGNDDIIDDDIILEQSGREKKKKEGKTISDRHQNYKIQFLKFSEKENLDVTTIVNFTIFSGKDSNNENDFQKIEEDKPDLNNMADIEWLELCGINDEFWDHIFDSTNSWRIIRLSEQIKQKNAKNDKERGCPSDTTDLSKAYLTFLNQEITGFELKHGFLSIL